MEPTGLSRPQNIFQTRKRAAAKGQLAYTDLEPELAVVPEALRAIHKGVAALWRSNNDVRVGALVCKGADGALATLVEWQGGCGAAC